MHNNAYCGIRKTGDKKLFWRKSFFICIYCPIKIGNCVLLNLLTKYWKLNTVCMTQRTGWLLYKNKQDSNLFIFCRCFSFCMFMKTYAFYYDLTLFVRISFWLYIDLHVAWNQAVQASSISYHNTHTYITRCIKRANKRGSIVLEN